MDEASPALQTNACNTHPAAKPYLWPIAHGVRPAAQSLGVRYCTDCHDADEGFMFGDVAIDSPVSTDERDAAKKMTDFQDVDPLYAWAFSSSFVFRPVMKLVAIGSTGVLALVLVLYVLKALGCFAKVLGGKN